MRTIKLTQGYVALVDDEDYERLSWYKWQVRKRADSRNIYAQRRQGNQVIRMHRDILNIPHSIMGASHVVDHINRNGLDNRKENLRVVTQRQNALNCRIGINNKTKITGVCYSRGRWIAQAPHPVTSKSHKLYSGKDFFLACCARKSWEAIHVT